MRRALLLLGAVTLAAFVGVVFWWRSPRPLAPIVLIVVDTLRADHLGCYGYFRPTSPHIDAFAGDALLFEKAMTPIGSTLAAHTSLFTATNPSRHGVRGNFKQFHVPVRTDRLQLAAQVLSRLGYRTAGIVSSPAVSRETGIAAGFDFYDDEFSPTRRGEQTTDRVLRWLDEAGDEPFFLFIHYIDPHGPHRPPAPYDAMFEADDKLREFLEQRGVPPQPDTTRANNGYDGEIRYVDEHIGRLFEGLRQRKLYDRSAIVFTADHGEGLGQHGWIYHSRIYNEQMRVPLIIRLPGHDDLRGRRLPEVVSLIDILPTLSESLDLPLPRAVRSQFEGVNVLGGARREHVFAERLPAHAEDPEPGEYFALASLEWKFFLRSQGENQLFDMRTDAAEMHNVIGEHPEVADSMHTLLQRQLREYHSSAGSLRQKAAAEIPESSRERLRNLGYDRE